MRMANSGVKVSIIVDDILVDIDVQDIFVCA
jgi:hypothetical protein